VKCGLVAVCLLAATLAEASRRHESNRVRTMLDQNRTPGRPGDGQDQPHIFDVCDMRGAWYNQHGSELVLNQTDDGLITGEFRSAVRLSSEHNRRGPDYTETSQSAWSYSAVHGRVIGSLFTLHAYWTDAATLTTWSGQCHRQCDLPRLRSDREVLHATWLITSTTNTCHDYWKATRIGEDIFSRLPLKAGPRRDQEISAVKTAAGATGAAA